MNLGRGSRKPLAILNESVTVDGKKYLNMSSDCSMKNKLKETREALLMSKAELAREANVSPITISRIEKGMPCRMETKRKLLLALGLDISDKYKIFND